MSDSVKIETAHGTIEVISQAELRRLRAFERAWVRITNGDDHLLDEFCKARGDHERILAEEMARKEKG